jgi:Domain of unknown function (DUF397)
MITQKPDSLVWRKSSRSGNGGSCIEVAWRKSSHSGGNGNCVEVAATPVGVLLRDSKNPDGPTLAVGTGQWREFVGRLSPSRCPM